MTHINHPPHLFRKIFGLLLALCLLGGGALLLSPLVRADEPLPDKTGATNTTFGKSLEGTKEPVAAGSGAYYFNLPLLNLGGPMGLHFDLIYRSDFRQKGLFFPPDFPTTFWWNLKYKTEEIIDDGKTVTTVQIDSGDVVAFWKDGSDWKLVNASDFSYPDNGSAVRYVLKETTDYLYFMDPITERVVIFDKTKWNRVVQVMDRSNNRLSYTYAEDIDDNPIRIEDGLGRSLDFTYTWLTIDRALTRITDQAGRQVNFGYDEGSDGGGDWWRLRTVTDPMNQTSTFTYTTIVSGSTYYRHNITAVAFPKGNAPYTQSYTLAELNGTTTARTASQADAYGNTFTFAYDAAQNRVTTIQPNGNPIEFQHHSNYGLPKNVADVNGNNIAFTKNITEQLTAVTDRLGDTTFFTYHPESGKLASLTNNKGHTVDYSYAAQAQTFTNPINAETVDFTFYNLSRVDYPDGTNEQFSYDASGNPTGYTDRAGQNWTTSYNGRGQPLTVTNPAGGITTYTYHADGTLASATDSDTGLTTYGYDAYKRPITVTHPAGSAQLAYNLNDQLTAITDERGKIYTYQYDLNGNLTHAVDPLTNQTQYAYDLMDRVISSTNRTGNVSDLAYDTMNRLAALTDPNSNTTQYKYDFNGKLNEITDPANNVWRIGYDAEGVATSLTNPLGHVTAIGRDKLGYTAAITNPLGHKTSLTRDAMNRVTAVTDPLNRTTGFSYDNRGLLSGVTLPDGSSTSYARNNLGRLTRITDLAGKQWDFTYTTMGRLQSLTDPVSNQWQYGYNSRGLLNQITYPAGGGNQTLTYDAAANVTRRQFSAGGLDLQYSYDDLNRLISTSGLTLTYNAEGQVTNTQNPPLGFGATYDVGWRLQAATYNDGAFAVTYQYNSRDLLTRVSDDLTNAWVEFDYDDAGRLTNIRRSNSVTTSLTWDNASRLTRRKTDTSGDALLDLQFTLNAAGEVTEAVQDMSLNPADYLAAQTDSFSYDDAHQINSAGYSYDTQGRLTAAPGGRTFTWDAASRLTRVVSGATTVDLTYNGLGDLQTRAAGGASTRFYYNYALGLTPIVAEKEEGGAFQRYYVWTPGGRLLYMIDAANGNAVYFYHFDRTGSTLALTNSSGSQTDAYAYTPYGQLLHHQGSTEQPFTFVGQYGVRQEGESGAFYQMRARYYDAAAARFISRESLWPRITEPQALNPYQYAADNPLSYIDPTGFEEELYVTRLIRSEGLLGVLFDATMNNGQILFYDAIRKAREEAAEEEMRRQVNQNIFGPSMHDRMEEFDREVRELWPKIGRASQNFSKAIRQAFGGLFNPLGNRNAVQNYAGQVWDPTQKHWDWEKMGNRNAVQNYAGQVLDPTQKRWDWEKILALKGEKLEEKLREHQEWLREMEEIHREQERWRKRMREHNE